MSYEEPNIFDRLRRDFRSIKREFQRSAKRHDEGMQDNIDNLIVSALTELKNPTESNLKTYIDSYINAQKDITIYEGSSKKKSAFFDHGNITTKKVMKEINKLTDEERENPLLILEKRAIERAAQEQVKLDHWYKTEGYKDLVDHISNRIIISGQKDLEAEEMEEVITGLNSKVRVRDVVNSIGNYRTQKTDNEESSQPVFH